MSGTVFGGMHAKASLIELAFQKQRCQDAHTYLPPKAAAPGAP
jgi:hypothetical protein